MIDISNDLKNKMLDTYFEYLDNNNLFEPDIAIHCSTKEKAEYLIAMYYASGKMWSVTSPLILNKEYVTRWGKDKQNTCYRVNENDFNLIVKSIAGFYEKKGVLIVEFENLFPFIELKEKEVEISEPVKTKNKLFGNKKKEKPNDIFAENTQDTVKEKTNDEQAVPKADICEDKEEKLPEQKLDDVSNSNCKDDIVLTEKTEELYDESFTTNMSNEQKSNDLPKSDSLNIPINKGLIIGNAKFRFNDSLILEEKVQKYVGGIAIECWHPCFDADTIRLVLVGLKNGDVKFET